MFDRLTARRFGTAAVALSAPMLFAPSAVAQTTPQKLVADAQTTLSDFMRDPDQTWIHDNIGRAKALHGTVVHANTKWNGEFYGAGRKCCRPTSSCAAPTRARRRRRS